MIRKAGTLAAALLAVLSLLVAPFVQPSWVLGALVLAAGLLLYIVCRDSYLALATATLAGLYGFGLIPLFVFSIALVIVMVGEIVFEARGGVPVSYVYYVLAGTLGAVLVMRYQGVTEPLAVLFGIVVAALLKAILAARERWPMRPVIEAIGIAMTIYLIEELNYHAEPSLVTAAVVIALAFGYFSFRLRAADISGLFSGSLIGIILIVFADPRWFLIMLLFFILGSGATRYKYDFKEKIGVEQTGGGARGYQNIFANGIVAATAAVLYGITVQPVFAALYVGAVATAAADTMASEIGVTNGIPYLITTFKQVPAGTNGGITLTGEVVGLAGALAVSVFAWVLGVIDPVTMVITTIAGFAGTNIDSLSGATIENRGLIGNAGTNLIATLGGGLLAALIFVAV
jgi:uncharacterized protein (TIGR00297 family)